ncbi:putative RNA 2'-phosphotransferase [Saccharibacillus brassicae]
MNESNVNGKDLKRHEVHTQGSTQAPTEAPTEEQTEAQSEASRESQPGEPGAESAKAIAERDKKISKLMTMMLRHAPADFGLRLDPEDGSCDLSDLLAAVRLRSGYEHVTEADLRGVVRRSDKQRFEILEAEDQGESAKKDRSAAGESQGFEAAETAEAAEADDFDAKEAAPRIRARYGHSYEKLAYPQGTPPETLYHGTNRRALPAILEHGLLPMGRRYVHLSAETHFAALAGQRRGKLVLLTVDTAAASQSGIAFYDAGSGVWLAERVPADVLTEAAESTESAESSNSSEAVRSVKPLQGAEPSETAQPALPAETTQSAPSAETTQSALSAGPRQTIDIGVNLMHRSFGSDRERVVEAAAEAGVTPLILTGTSVRSSQAAAEYARAYPGRLYATAGVHPHDAKSCDAHTLQALRELAAGGEVVAIGECGLDYNRDFSPRDVQREVFAQQIGLAAELALPLFLHERDAHADFARLLREHRPENVPAVVHCFTGSGEELRAYLEMGLHIGITGWICDERRGRHLRELVRLIPPDRLMIETDAPFLTPRDLRPKPKDGRNEPAFLPHIAAAVAECTGRSAESVMDQTTETAKIFFNIGNGKSGL